MLSQKGEFHEMKLPCERQRVIMDSEFAVVEEKLTHLVLLFACQIKAHKEARMSHNVCCG